MGIRLFQLAPSPRLDPDGPRLAPGLVEAQSFALGVALIRRVSSALKEFYFGRAWTSRFMTSTCTGSPFWLSVVVRHLIKP